jgi:predicted amidohydrolase YtcJ
MAAAGIVLALGSDSPVTPLDPWGGVRAAVRHRTPGSGVDPTTAFDAHTRGGWWAARRDADGVVTAGAPATFAVWAPGELDPITGLPPLGAEDPAPECLRTVVRGITVHDTLG